MEDLTLVNFELKIIQSFSSNLGSMGWSCWTRILAGVLRVAPELVVLFAWCFISNQHVSYWFFVRLFFIT